MLTSKSNDQGLGLASAIAGQKSTKASSTTRLLIYHPSQPGEYRPAFVKMATATTVRAKGL
jgi:hypothetical protein